jgi:hypothetical protein
MSSTARLFKIALRLRGARLLPVAAVVAIGAMASVTLGCGAPPAAQSPKSDTAKSDVAAPPKPADSAMTAAQPANAPGTASTPSAPNAQVAGATGAASATTADAQAKPAAPPSKITARHVLVQWMGCVHAAPSVVRTRDQALAVAEDVLRRAKAGDDFARLAVEFSDEPNAGQRGGSLGRFGHGQMVKAFEEAAFALKPGEISGIVETGFGFHVIQRTE